MTELKAGSKVMLRPDVLVRHSRSIPAHLGYTKEEFAWRDTLGKLKGKTGKVERMFPNSRHINGKFGKTLIGIDRAELVRKQEKKKWIDISALENIGKHKVRGKGVFSLKPVIIWSKKKRSVKK